MQPALAAIVLVAGFALAFYWVLFDADEGFCLLVVGLAGLAAAFYRTEPAGRRLDRRLRELREGRA